VVQEVRVTDTTMVVARSVRIPVFFTLNTLERVTGKKTEGMWWAILGSNQ